MVNKKLVKERFEKNIKTYEKNAVVQKQMASYLIEKLINESKSFESIFEIGCGAGILTKKIHSALNFEKLFLNDLVECQSNENFIQGDCEKVEFPLKLDLVISNAALQWVEDLPALFDKVTLSLNSGGLFAFTTFGEQNFYQIKSVTGNSLNYLNKSTIEQMLSKNFKIIYAHEDIINLEFDSVHLLLKHLQLSGVNALEKMHWTKKDLIAFENKYKDFCNENGKFVLTYHPLYFICAKLQVF